MKIALSATGLTLDDEVDPRFGRCQYFIIVDTDTMEFEAVDNTSAMQPGGAGISTGQMIAGKGAQVVLTGNCGPNAYQVLSSAGIQVITGVGGKIRDAVNAYKSGQLQASAQPNVSAHSGTGGGMGMGGGMGRGMGGGMGRGMGAGTTPGFAPTPQPASPEQEIEALKAQAQMLAQQLTDIQRHIDELGKKKG